MGRIRTTRTTRSARKRSKGLIVKGRRYEYTHVIRKNGVRRAVIRIRATSYIKYLFHRLRAAQAAKNGHSYEYDVVSNLRQRGK